MELGLGRYSEMVYYLCRFNICKKKKQTNSFDDNILE